MSTHDLNAADLPHKRESIDAHRTIVFAAVAITRYIEDRTGWSIKKIVHTTCRYRTVQIRATRQRSLPPQTPLPTDLRDAYHLIHRPLARSLSRKCSSTMSGTFCISGEATWMPTGWVFDGVLGRVFDQLDAVQAPLAMELLDAERHSESAYGNFEGLDSMQLAAFLEAAETAFKNCISRASVHDVYFVGFMWSFSALKGLLRTDSRLPERSATGAIKINDEALWVAPSCIFDLVMEHMAVRIRLSNTHLGSELLVARIVEGGGQCDLCPFDIARYSSVLAAAEELQIRYGGGEGGDSYHPSFFREVAEQVTALRQQLENDNRARG